MTSCRSEELDAPSLHQSESRNYKRKHVMLVFTQRQQLEKLTLLAEMEIKPLLNVLNTSWIDVARPPGSLLINPIQEP
ncbi:hypothetical protein ILYODFUR_034774 [Ilyodon furcidens]|uniref:Uncharacterized protein n=1 Tax=Ilyodon furcidens TaxID=33524 RepID=A0ABV0SRZ7_9TELE